jgi:hypothetical protein
MNFLTLPFRMIGAVAAILLTLGDDDSDSIPQKNAPRLRS